MDAFEDLTSQLLIESGLWVLQSVKVELTQEEKKKINKPTTPRPEIDIVAYDRSEDTLYLIEVKSYIDSNGVKIEDLTVEYEIQEGRYKLLTCQNYRNVIKKRLRNQMIKRKYITQETKLNFGLIAGNIHKNNYKEIKKLYNSKNWFFWGPEEIKDKIRELSKKGYEDNAVIMTAKLLLK